MKTAHQITAILLISVILGSSLFYLTTPIALTDNDEDKSGYYVTLEIYQYREGELIDKHIVEDDFILRNWVYLWLNIFCGDRWSESNDYKLQDIDNVERALPFNLWFVPEYAKIRLGTGTNPVTVTNYKLQTEVLSLLIDDGTVWVTGNQFNVTSDMTIVSDDSYSITEAGLSIRVIDYEYLICRDVFSPISVNLDDVIMVRYIFRFNI